MRKSNSKIFWDVTQKNLVFEKALELVKSNWQGRRRAFWEAAQAVLPPPRHRMIYGSAAQTLTRWFESWVKLNHPEAAILRLQGRPVAVQDEGVPTRQTPVALPPPADTAPKFYKLNFPFCPNCRFDLRSIEFKPL